MCIVELFFMCNGEYYEMCNNKTFFYETDISAEADHHPIKQAGYLLSAILPVWIFLKCSRNYFRNAGEIIVSALI